MNNRVKLDSSDTIPNNLKLTGSVSLKSGVDAIVTKLNDIPANTWVKSGIDVDTKQEQWRKQDFIKWIGYFHFINLFRYLRSISAVRV